MHGVVTAGIGPYSVGACHAVDHVQTCLASNLNRAEVYEAECPEESTHQCLKLSHTVISTVRTTVISTVRTMAMHGIYFTWPTGAFRIDKADCTAPCSKKFLLERTHQPVQVCTGFQGSNAF